MAIQQEIWLISGMFAVTFLIRFIMFAMAGNLRLPAPLQQALSYVPPAVLTAIIVPSVVLPHGTVELSFSNSYLVAGVVSFFVALISRNLLLTIGLGMAFFMVYHHLL
ncbi:AzlD domain-containing protein [Motilimonas cestriensis]|uniref:AzlD domain-containing protein n=1 Tax=Motilimonas cestriensis TaxID=2742685 RepID=A0ABS8WFF5_9GAMM|nr:AzlD domain-containing protein [Motilimonas cestriensis]MCE2597062.1 AzlD domain-containing protein [Motilimonas cestriensis]